MNTNCSPLITNNIIAHNLGYGVWQEDTSCSPTPTANCLLHNTDGNYQGMSPGAGDLLLQFWETAEQDGLHEALDRLNIALADSGRDLSRVKALIAAHYHPT